jgi:hypothetical protein
LASLHVGDDGTVVEFTMYREDGTTVLPLGDATELRVDIIRPDQTLINGVAELTTDGSDGKLFYVIVDGDLNQAGPYKFQPVVTKPDGHWHGDVRKEKVKGNVDEDETDN